MNKRLKSLVCIWLVVIMLVGMLPMTALAEDDGEGEGTPEPVPNAWIWTGTVPLREASAEQFDSGLKYGYINTEEIIDKQFTEIPEGTDLLRLVAWGEAISGVVFGESKKYELGQKVSDEDLRGADIFEPVFSNVQITTPPEADNDFTAGVKVYDASDDTPPYAWRAAAVENEPGLSYQWYQQTEANITWVEGMPSVTEASGAQRYGVLDTGNNKNDGTLASESVYGQQALLLFIALNSGDSLTLTTKGNVDFVFLTRTFPNEFGVGIGSGFEGNANDGRYSVTNDTSVPAVYLVGVSSSEEFTAMLDVTAAVPLEGRTSASLLTGDPLTAGTYLCKVSYDSYPGEGDEAEANYVYTAWSAPVVYTHTHCICGATHEDVGDHDEAVPTDFTAITTETELRNAATTGGNVYLANDIALNSTIEVTGNLNLCLNGHSIRPVNADTCGRAFKVESAVTFNLTDCGTTGAITGFKTTTDIDGGAGVLFKNGTNFNMYGGSISGNTSSGSGGGVAIYDSSVEVGLYGGSITGNTATGNGGGVFARDYQTTIKIAGNPKVADNTNGTQASNCYQAYFQIVGPLANTAKLSINSDQLETTVSVGKYATGVTGSYESCFVHDYWDSSKYVCEKDDNGNISMFQFSEITFDANGGTGTMTSQKVPLRQNTALKLNTFTPPSGKVFSYWSYNENGGGPDRFQDGGTINRFYADPLTLYAIWGNPTYEINKATTENGSFSVPATATASATVTIMPTPDPGYEVDTITVNKTASGDPVAVTDNGNGTYSFTMPASNVTVSVTFRKLLTGAYLGDEVITTYSGEEGVYLSMYFNGTPTTRHVDFVSSDPGVVSIERYADNQVILNPHSAGLVTITGTTQDGGFTDTCTVYVCEISDQPTADNDYTVTVTPEDKVKYQWGKGQEITIDVEMETDGNKTTIKDDLGNVATIFDFYDLYDSENQCWKPRTYFNNYGWEYAAEYFEIETCREGVLKVTLSRPLVAGESFKLVPAYFSLGSVREEIIPKADGSIIIPSERLSNSASYTLVIVKEDYEGDISTLPTVTATFTTDAYLALDGQTTKTLDTEGLEGEYACCVTWDPDPTDEYIRFQKITDIVYIAPTYAVNNGTADTHGTVSMDKATAKEGEIVIITVTPAEGYEVDTVAVYKTDEENTTVAVDGGKFTMPDYPVTVSVTFREIVYNGTVSNDPGAMGGVEADGLNTVANALDKNIVLTVEPEAASSGDSEQTAIKGAAGSRTLEFIDITLKDNSGNPVEVPQSTVLEIAIPFTVGNKQNITVYRHHNGTAAAFTALNTRPADDARTDGTFYVDSMNNKIYIYTNKFSTYAIGYSEPAPYSPPIYSITAVDGENGKITVSSKWAYFSSTVTITVKPDAGYQLGTLAVTDTRGNEIALRAKDDGTYTFMMPSRNVKVKATFVSNGSYATCTGDSSCPMYGYTDLDCEAWYHDGVHYAIEKGLMSGYGDGIFKPNAETTRAMITVMLWRLNGSPVVNYLLDFEDVAEGQWYTEAIRWAKSEGIAGGYGNGYFGTNDAITREQMVTILWRYAKYKGADVSVGEDTNILSYNDASDVAEYAIPAMQWACGSGMVQGTNDPNGEGMILDPESNAVRAQAATLMQRFCENILK